MLGQFSHMAIGRGSNILTLCPPVRSASSRMGELPACVSTLFDLKKTKRQDASKWDATLF